MPISVTILASKNKIKNSKILYLTGTFHSNSDLEKGIPPIQISSQNGKIKILLTEFHHRTNMTALLLSNLGFRNIKMHAQNFEICKT
jgi:hypothetical protein